MTIRKLLIAALIIAAIPALLIAFFVLNLSVIQPWAHSINTERGRKANEAELSDGNVEIHQLAFWVEVEGKRIKVWSELACARKWKTAPKTLKGSGYSRFSYFGLNAAQVRFSTSADTDYVATPRSGLVCNKVANLERDLPLVLGPYDYDVSVEPAMGSCRDFLDTSREDGPVYVIGPLQVRSTRTVPMNEVFTREAYAPDAVDASLEKTNEVLVPDLTDQIEKLDKSLCR